MLCESNIFQAVRVVDVFVLGPAMIKTGDKVGGRLGMFLVLAGVATIVFNGLTFLEIQDRK